MMFSLLGMSSTYARKEVWQIGTKCRKMCVYVGYSKGIPEDYFSSDKDNKVFVMYKYKVSR